MAPWPEVSGLWDALRQGGDPTGELNDRGSSVALAALGAASILPGPLESFRGRSVLLATRAQLPTALTLIELDGIARRMVLCTPDLTAAQLASVAASAKADLALVDEAAPENVMPVTALRLAPELRPSVVLRRGSESTEWVLLTSGTTGMPKLVTHSLESLGGALPRAPSGKGCVWSTFYDIRRYGGLQIYLRAVLAGVPLVLGSVGESVRDFLARAGGAGVTHLSGTPSHWRSALMSGDTALLDPEYVRLSGEVADQALLDTLKATYPKARIAHAFASTEAGVAFEVNDGRAGFPKELIEACDAAIELKVEGGTLRVRSGRTAAGYLGAQRTLPGEDGWVDTGDLVELHEGRYYFRGRKGGIINVGGNKVYPEEVESVLNADPRVKMSLVRARPNPFTGAVVVAEVVLAEPETQALGAGAADHVKIELLAACRRALPAHKVPAALTFVAALELTAAGKLVRPGA